MAMITAVSVIYILFGLMLTFVFWWSATQYDDEGWQRQRVTWELLFVLIFVWPIYLMGLNKQTVQDVISFYKKHPKLLFNIVAITTSLNVIIVSLLSITG